MVYKVIGLMSGSSLDGLDIAHVQLEEVRGQWGYQFLHTDCISYPAEWITRLQQAANISVGDFLKLNTAYGRYLGEQVNGFITKNSIEHQVHFIASHGHTVFHEPGNYTTFQLGDGASIAAVTKLPVISDLRSLDVALGGQGAPIVPIGDKLLFGTYDYLLNIGGIANITVYQHGNPVAFDICAANQVLNTLAMREGKPMDENGEMAATGKLLGDVLDNLNDSDYYKLLPPKSLSNEAARSMVFPKLLESEHSTADLLHTVCVHIAQQVAAAVGQSPHGKEKATLLATGGGAFNTFLMQQLQHTLAPLDVEIVIPGDDVIQYKEALVMALIGTLRWREETNVLSSVTGAVKDSCGGALWLG
jgi:anhydro-N-acetylmuramic acid kinase